MLVFGHAGITLGTAVLLTGAVANSRFSKAMEKEVAEPCQHSSQVVPTMSDSPSCKTSWLISLTGYIDIRLLLIASLLPDIIDKPLGCFFFRETFTNGRIFCHTLLFLILITAAGFYLYKHHSKTWLLTLSFGTLTHLIFDQMWRTPQTLLWPLYGLTFGKIDITNLIPKMLYALITDPEVYVPELVGAAIITWFAWILLRERKTLFFIKYGRIQ